MKTFKKAWLLVSLLSVSALVLAACGAAATTAAPAAPVSPTEAPAPTEAMAEPMDMCMGAASGDTVSIVYQLSGDEEDLFKAAVQPLLDQCGIVLQTESTRDQALLDTRVQAGTPYDIVIWPSTAPVVAYGDQLQALDSLGGHADNYSDAWKVSSNGNWVAVGVKADPKTIVWYSPVNFEANGYSVPTTWDEFTALADQMVADGNVPFSMGFESGDATGWTASDFIQDILLTTQGPDFVNGIIDGTVSYDDPGVAEAYQIYSNWATDPAYSLGGADGALSTSFSDALLKPFSDPPEAMMVKQSGFAGGNIKAQYPELEYGTDFAFFPFPGAQGVQSGADWMMAFNDTPAVEALVSFITSADGGAAWAEAGFGLSPNNGSTGHYMDPTNADLAAVLANAKAATPDLGDSIQPTFPTAEWKAIVDVVSGASSIQDALANAAAAQHADQMGQ